MARALNEHRRGARHGWPPIRSDRHLPGAAVALHRLGVAELQAGSAEDVVGGGHPSRQARRGRGCEIVQAEPSWPRQGPCLWIRGGNFEVDRCAEREKKVVRSHVGMFPPRARRHAKGVGHELRSGSQGRSDDYEVIESGRHVLV
jgi:hypothetical protein